jgi:hypothetical protein
MTILNPISWAKANTGAVIAAAVGGVVFVIASLLKFQYALGLNFALAYLAARWAEVAWHALRGTPLTSSTRRR